MQRLQQLILFLAVDGAAGTEHADRDLRAEDLGSQRVLGELQQQGRKSAPIATHNPVLTRAHVLASVFRAPNLRRFCGRLVAFAVFLSACGGDRNSKLLCRGEQLLWQCLSRIRITTGASSPNP